MNTMAFSPEAPSVILQFVNIYKQNKQQLSKRRYIMCRSCCKRHTIQRLFNHTWTITLKVLSSSVESSLTICDYCTAVPLAYERHQTKCSSGPFTSFIQHSESVYSQIVNTVAYLTKFTSAYSNSLCISMRLIVTALLSKTVILRCYWFP